MKMTTFIIPAKILSKHKDVICCEVITNCDYPTPSIKVDTAIFENRDFPREFLRKVDGCFAIVLKSQPGLMICEASLDADKVKWATKIFAGTRKELSKRMSKLAKRLEKSKMFTPIKKPIKL